MNDKPRDVHSKPYHKVVTPQVEGLFRQSKTKLHKLSFSTARFHSKSSQIVTEICRELTHYGELDFLNWLYGDVGPDEAQLGVISW